MSCEVVMALEKERSNTAQSKFRGKLELTLLLVSLSFCVIFSFVLSPLITYVNNDGTISYLPDILEAMQWVVNLLCFFICYSITDFAIYRFRISKYWIFVFIFSVMTVIKYLLNLVSAFFVFGRAPSDKEQLKQQIATVVLHTVIELLQYALVVISSTAILSKFKKLSDIAEKSAEKIGIDYDRRDKVFPFEKLVSKKNPLQYSALWTAIIVTLFMLANRVVFDIYFGLPQDLIDGLWMAGGYLSDVLFGVLGYLIMMLVFNRCDTSDIKHRLKYDK